MERLENKEVAVKQQAMKDIIALLLNGEIMAKILMTVIKFVVPQDDHMLKKLLLVYWELVDKIGADGNLMPEMFLVWYVRCSQIFVSAQACALHGSETGYLDIVTLRFS